MRRRGITHVPLILGIVGVVAMAALVSDHNVRTWAIVMGFTTVAAVGYAAFQEQRAIRAVGIARRRSGGAPYDEVRREMDRARRHERPFALVRVRGRSPAASSPAVTGLVLDEATRPTFRSTDRFWRHGRDLYLLLPETNRASAEQLLTRRVGAGADAAEDWRVAAFPEDGVTVGALFTTLGATMPRGEDLVRPERQVGTGGGLRPAEVPQRADHVPRRRTRS